MYQKKQWRNTNIRNKIKNTLEKTMKRKQHITRNRKNTIRILLLILIFSIIINIGIITSLILQHHHPETSPVSKNNPSSTETQHDTNAETLSPIATPSSAPTLEPFCSATISFTGDLMVHSYQYEAAYDANTGNYDFSNNFTYVSKYFAQADYVVGNLETTLGGQELGIQDFPCFNSPDSFASTLKEAGFDFLSTANNHCVDQGTTALCRTIDVLDSLHFDHAGTYQTKQDSQNIFITNINGISVAFLSCTYGTNGMPFENDYNVQLLNDGFYKKIKKARKQADFVIVLPHNGTEYAQTPAEIYQQQYRKMLECGADAVIASHPHVLQPMEYQRITEKDGSTRTGFIMYSMGNFISSQVTKPRDAGTILTLNICKNPTKGSYIENVSIIPTWCRFTDATGQRNFTVFSVYDVLRMKEKKRRSLIRDKDYYRILQIQTESTETLLGTSIDADQAKKSYSFKQTKENFKY